LVGDARGQRHGVEQNLRQQLRVGLGSFRRGRLRNAQRDRIEPNALSVPDRPGLTVSTSTSTSTSGWIQFARKENDVSSLVVDDRSVSLWSYRR
jgi:hypothetical protein